MHGLVPTSATHRAAALAPGDRLCVPEHGAPLEALHVRSELRRRVRRRRRLVCRAGRCRLRIGGFRLRSVLVWLMRGGHRDVAGKDMRSQRSSIDRAACPVLQHHVSRMRETAAVAGKSIPYDDTVIYVRCVRRGRRALLPLHGFAAIAPTAAAISAAASIATAVGARLLPCRAHVGGHVRGTWRVHNRRPPWRSAV